MRTTLVAAALLSLAPCTAMADKLGDHPAIVVQRLQANQTYDYAAKFYPHPAWLYLAAEAPRPMMDHPAVIVAKRQQRELAEQERSSAAVVAQVR